VAVKRLYSSEELHSHSSALPATWRRAETTLVEEYDLTEDHAPWHDAREGDDSPVEIKSCAQAYADGRVGEFVIWEYQWAELVCRGQFAFLVYQPDAYHVLATHMTMPVSLRELGTMTRARHPTMGRRPLWRIPWPEVIPLDAIPAGMRRRFADHYSREEVEETPFLDPLDDRDS
jgi:hypothetical protein